MGGPAVPGQPAEPPAPASDPPAPPAPVPATAVLVALNTAARPPWPPPSTSEEHATASKHTISAPRVLLARPYVIAEPLAAPRVHRERVESFVPLPIKASSIE